MVFKINISDKTGKTYKLETEAEALVGKELGNKVQGTEVMPDLTGYELQITGASDKSGFTAMENVPGVGLKKELLGYGKAMHQRPKGDKKKPFRPQPGLRLRKTVRGKVISPAISQINLKVITAGEKPLEKIFEDQVKKEGSDSDSPNEGGTPDSAEKGGPEPTSEKPAEKVEDTSNPQPEQSNSQDESLTEKENPTSPQ